MRYQSFSARATSRRNGMVLLVVMAMLALFASVAISFVYYAESEAEAAHLARQAQEKDQADVDPELLAAYFLNQLLYPTDNLYSAMRGWDMATSIFGSNKVALNHLPYVGGGREKLSYPVPGFGKNNDGTDVDNFQLINYTKYEGLVNPFDPYNRLQRMPEFGDLPQITAATSGSPIVITTKNNHGLTDQDPVAISGVQGNTAANGYFAKAMVLTPTTFTLNPSNGNGTYTSGGVVLNLRAYRPANPPWTAYDTNSLFLAEVNANGTVVRPSFQPKWLADAMTKAPAAAKKYMSLFPDPTWHKDFAPDFDGVGNVKNLEFGPAGNDSKWMDLGFPVMTAANGKRYKVLFAPLIVDLNNRLHLWAHGNRIGKEGTHVSNMGLGATEVNPSKLPNFNANPLELQSLFNLKYGGLNGTPASLPLNTPIAFGRAGAWYSKVDLDGLDLQSKKSTVHLFTGFKTSSFNGVAGGGASGTMKVAQTAGSTNGGFNWAFFDAVTVGPPATQLVVDTGANSEMVTVTNVDPINGTFTAVFTKAHAAGTAISLNPYLGYPMYPSGWDNNLGNAEQAKGKPMGFNIHYNPATWGAATDYAVGAIVFYNGNGLYYECIQANNTGKIPPANPTFWALATNVNLGIGTQKGLQMSDLEALLRFGGTNSPALTSEIFRRMPLTFSDMRTRNMVTMWSMHFDRISAAAFLPYDPTLATAHYRYNPQAPNNDPYPKTFPIPLVPPSNTSTAPLPDQSEYGRDWRSTLGRNLRVNLNRTLTNYPNAAGGLIQPIDYPNYNQALADRQNFARDIYEALIRVTAAQDPNVVTIIEPAGYRAARWLAQLAVNIVDYIDDDDYITAFHWDRKRPDGWVYGTEQPRLVLNEAYAQFENDGADPSIYAAPPSQDTVKNLPTASELELNCWIELLNPLLDSNLGGTAFPKDRGRAILQNTTFSVYDVLVCRTSPALTKWMRDPANNSGDPTKVNGAVLGLPINGKLPYITNWGPTATTRLVTPANGAFSGAVTTRNIVAVNGASENAHIVTIKTTAGHPFKPGQRVQIAGVGPDTRYNGTFNILSNTPTTFTYYNGLSQLAVSGGGSVTVGLTDAGANMGPASGFYVLGPTTTVPKNPMFIAPKGMTPGRDPGLVTSFASPQMSFALTKDDQITNVTYVLRRLAVPHLPPLDDSTNPLYNPYITVDYLDNIQAYDGRVYDKNGVRIPPPPPVTAFQSFGRRQPYTAWPNAVATQIGGQPWQPKNTFFTHNSNATIPFTWLTHLDRPLVNQLELLQVSGYKPHELTQQFLRPANGNVPKGHQAPWDKPDALIYRALEVLGTPNHMVGNFRGGRWQGNINLNTLTEAEIFLALCDAQDTLKNPLFRTIDVASIYKNLLDARNAPALPPVPTLEGSPFQPLAAGDINRTWLRLGLTSPRPLFDVGIPIAHPYGQKALLQKIFNNITTTSNVFGVWWTAGYFEVVDESARPVRLGPEIGRAENRHIRHRFFAVVDRSGMDLFKTTSTKSSLTIGQNVAVWDPAIDYPLHTNVFYLGKYFRCTKANNKGIAPNVPPPPNNHWVEDCVAVGATWVPNPNPPYVVGSNVVYAGQHYRCNNNINAGKAPTDPKAWDLVTLWMNFTPPAGAANGVPIRIEPGMMLEIGGNEVVSVVAVNPAGNSFTANFTANRNVGASIVCRGNPGPRAAYNPRHDSSVVLHMSVIQ
jgi:hypothetical protein